MISGCGWILMITYFFVDYWQVVSSHFSGLVTGKNCSHVICHWWKMTKVERMKSPRQF